MGVRPSSSYEPRPKVKEQISFSPDVVAAMEEKLGLDVNQHPDFRWVIRDCLIALRDEGWACNVTGEDLEYVYMHTQEARSYHPIVEAHRKLAERLLHVSAELKMKRLDPFYRVKHIVYLAILGEKDCRLVTNPKTLE